MAEWRSYGSVSRIGRRSARRRVSVVRVTEWADSGAACLTMLMAHHGKQMELEELTRELGLDRNVGVRELIAGAQQLGMRARSVEPDDLAKVPRNSILHWEFGRFVVFERVVDDEVQIVDPTAGRLRLPRARANELFSGVAIVLERGAGFHAQRDTGGRMRRYVRLIFDQHRTLVRILVTSVLLRLLALALPIATALIVDHVVPRSDIHLLTVIGVGLLGMVCFQVLSSLIRAHLLLQLRTHLDISLTLDFLEHLVDLPYSFFQTRSAGDLMLRVASNSRIRRVLTSNTLSALLDGSLVLVYLVVLMVSSLPLGLLTLALGVAQISVFLRVRRRIGKLMREALSAQAKTQNYLVQVLTGIQTLKIAGAGQRAVERFSNFFVDELNVAIDNGRLQAKVDAAMTGLGSASPLLILGAGALLVLRADLSLGSMLALAALATGFLAPLGSLVTSALELQQLSGYIERINDVLTNPLEQEGERAIVPELSGRISMRKVSFRYDSKSPLVVRELDLEVEPGECVAIVGHSGSGKSTLASLLLGLYEPEEGTIEYDERPLARLDLRGVRRQIGYVPQDPYVFGLRMRDNIAMAEPGIAMRSIELAARRAAIHDDIMATRLGYNTLVSDGGGSLSGGQRQRLAIARALVNEPPILILDEATSALDTRTEKRVMDELERMSCVRIIIAHRLSTIAFADKIVVMDHGRVIDVGTHAELLERCEIYGEFIAASGAGGTSRLRVMQGSDG